MTITLESIDQRLARLERAIRKPAPQVYRLADIASITGLSLSQIRKLSRGEQIPGKLPGSRKVKLYIARAIDAWVASGMPAPRTMRGA